MISFPNAKINLGLNILRKRPDGYHDIESCLYPAPFTDVLEIVQAENFSFANTGLAVDNKHGDNLCIKAFRLLRKDYNIPEISMHLHKVIPMGAGLGGGSADAAFSLKQMDQLFKLNLGSKKLSELASQLGSDCPFFIDNKPALVTGTGTDLAHIPLDLSGKHLMLVFPDFPISTAEAYANVRPKAPDTDLGKALTMPLASWKDHIRNDFEESLFPKYPELAKIKKDLYGMGAEYAAMSGSGSTMFGIFNNAPGNFKSHKKAVFEL